MLDTPILTAHERKCIARSNISYLFSEMRGDTIHFYGNDGVCIFKYLVRTNDPQWVFSSSVLLMNCLCFLFISISYILIGYKIKLSGKTNICKPISLNYKVFFFRCFSYFFGLCKFTQVRTAAVLVETIGHCKLKSLPSS